MWSYLTVGRLANIVQPCPKVDPIQPLHAAQSLGPSSGELSSLAGTPGFHSLGLVCLINYPQHNLRGKSGGLWNTLTTQGKILAVLFSIVENGLETGTLE